MASFPPPPETTSATETATTTFLSSSQLTGIASKLATEQDRQKYRHLISLSSTIQTQLNQLRLDRMNAVSFDTQRATTAVEGESLDIHRSTVLTDLGHKELATQTTPPSAIESDKRNSEADQPRGSLSVTTGSYSTTSPACLQSPTPSPPLPEFHALQRQDSAVEIMQQEPIPPSLVVGQYTDKALPTFPSPKRDSNKYDSIFDTTSYYYEEQQQQQYPYEHQKLMDRRQDYPLPPPYLLPKTGNATVDDHLGLPSPSSVLDTHYKYGNLSNINKDPSFLLITPPDTPRYIDCLHTPATPATPSTPLYKEQQPLPLPPIIPCQKKINGLFGFLTRTYQINEIVSSRILISSLGLFNAMDTSTGHEKAVLKVTMTSNQVKIKDRERTLDETMLELFGFTFYASVKRSPNVKRPHREDPHCLVVSDYLISDALDYWIQHQTDGLPILTNATHILKDSVKIYVVYDKALLLQEHYC